MWVSGGGKRREMGLGPYPAVPLSAARLKAAECRSVVAAGGDPIAMRARVTEPTFGECADAFLASLELILAQSEASPTMANDPVCLRSVAQVEEGLGRVDRRHSGVPSAYLANQA